MIPATKTPPSGFSRPWRWLGLLSLLLLSFVFQLARVSGQSMEPTLQDGQIVILERFRTCLARAGLLAFKHGDLTVLNWQHKRYIKRIVALPGDAVSVKLGAVYLNEQRLPEPYLKLTSSWRRDSFPEVLVQGGKIVAFEGYAMSELPDYLKPTLRMLEPLPEAVLEQSLLEPLTTVGSIKLEPGYYFVLGDNRSFNASEDSRFFGPIRHAAITGLVYPF